MSFRLSTPGVVIKWWDGFPLVVLILLLSLWIFVAGTYARPLQFLWERATRRFSSPSVVRLASGGSFGLPDSLFKPLYIFEVSLFLSTCSMHFCNTVGDSVFIVVKVSSLDAVLDWSKLFFDWILFSHILILFFLNSEQFFGSCRRASEGDSSGFIFDKVHHILFEILVIEYFML